ncbi:hypothetical protein H5410_053222, partial [Solanum commersonii]
MDSFISSRNNVMKSSSGSCFPETSKALELHFSNYLEVVSDIGIEDTIVDNREDNGVDKNFLIEKNSTKVVLQGIRGDVTNEVDEEFSDPDYNLSDEDDDFQDVIDDQQVLIDDQQVLIDDQQVKKLRGRPKNASVNVPVSSEIFVPLQNADVESDYTYLDELPDDDVQSDKEENNGQKNNIYEEYDEGLQYGKLLSYRAELLRFYPGSNVIIWRDGGKFLEFYVCLGALNEAFKLGCRPLISLDGCWLKGTYRGNLLSAVAIDPNDYIFPVAYVMCSICKKHGHNARGHYKFVKAGESSPSHYLEAISPTEEASNDGDYLNMYRSKMWNNNHQGLNLAYQPTITQAPIEEQVIVVQTDVVAAQGVDEVAIKGIETTRLSHTSKRGRLFKRKVMKEYIVELQKKIGNHSK